MANKKMGRPTDNPKPYRVYARLDTESKEILDAYTNYSYGSCASGY